MTQYQVTITTISSSTQLLPNGRAGSSYNDHYNCYNKFEIFYLFVMFIANLISAISIPLPWYYINDQTFYTFFPPANNYFLWSGIFAALSLFSMGICFFLCCYRRCMGLGGTAFKISMFLNGFSLICSVIAAGLPINPEFIPTVNFEPWNQGYSTGFYLIWVSVGIRLIVMLLNIRMIYLTKNDEDY